MFIEPTITWVPSRFSGYIWLDTKIVLTKFFFLNIIYCRCMLMSKTTFIVAIYKAEVHFYIITGKINN